MVDPSPYSDSGEEASAETGREVTPGTPRWVKVSGIVALIVVLVVVVLLVIGGGSHGPGRHVGADDPGRRTPSGDAGGHRRSSGVAERSGGHIGPPPGADHDARR
jgi:hypothetical protein